jgi:hypothetical protein
MKIVRIENFLSYSLIKTVVQMQFVFHLEDFILKKATNFLVFWVIHFKERTFSLKFIVIFSLHLIESGLVDFDKNV